MLRTRENSDVFNSLDEIYLVFTSKKQISSIYHGIEWYDMARHATLKKVNVGNDQEIVQSERNSHSKNRDGKKTKLTIRYLY